MRLLANTTPTSQYSPRIFESLGITGTDTRLLSTGVYGIARAIGMFTFTFFVAEKVGRRRGLIWGGFLGSIPLWYIGAYVRIKNPLAALEAGQEISRDGWGYLAMVAVYMNAIIICATWQGVSVPMGKGVEIGRVEAAREPFGRLRHPYAFLYVSRHLLTLLHHR